MPPSALTNTGHCPEQSAADRVASADLILTGEVFAVIPSPQGVDVIISPSRLFRGTIPAGGVRIAASAGQRVVGAGSNSTSELHFASGQAPYLLFLKSRTDGRYDTQSCFGSRPLGTGLTTEEQSAFGPGQAVE